MSPNELNHILRLFFALVVVLALIVGVGLLIRRLNNGHMNIGERRLHIVEALPLDARRRLILLRRDDREHLVILGTNGETVVEQGIESRQDKAP